MKCLSMHFKSFKTEKFVTEKRIKFKNNTDLMYFFGFVKEFLFPQDKKIFSSTM